MNLSRHKQEHLSLIKLSKVGFGMDMLTLEYSRTSSMSTAANGLYPNR